MEESPRKKSANIGLTEFENDAIQKCGSPVDSFPRWNYDILRIIFHYLPANDLQNVAKVCRSWLEAAHKEKQSRKHPEYNFYKDDSCKVKLIDSMWIEPYIGFYFLTRSFQGLNVKHLINRTLPGNYVSILIKVDGIFLEKDTKNKDNTKTFFWQTLGNIDYILSVYLPQIPNIHIDTFMERDVPSSDMFSTEEAFKKFVDKVMTDNALQQNLSHENSLCFMLFYNNHLARPVISVLKERCTNKRVSLWGGQVGDIFSEQANGALFNLRIAVIAISGLMQSWSVIVDIRWEKKQIENRLTIFKDQVKLKKYSIGFVFAKTYNADFWNTVYENKELTIFKRVFPQVPLVACSSGRGFGMDTDPISDEQEEYKKFQPSPEPWFHEFCTVLMILTYD